MFRDNASLLQQAFSQVSFSAGWSPCFWSFVPKVLQISKKSTIQGRTLLQTFFQEIKVFVAPPGVGVVVGILIALTPFLAFTISEHRQQQTSISGNRLQQR
jgi:hypothetical protein